MFGKGYPLFRLLGFQVKVDPSWLFLALLVAWSLAKGLFPAMVPGLTDASYWLMGIAGVIGLLLSIVIHEFCHSLVARVYGLPIGGISLFLFGGVAEMQEEPPSPKAEFLMAVAGPVASIVLAALLFGGYLLLNGGWPDWVVGILFYLAYLNLVLAIFNLLPAFPLDGGRMLRAVLWGWRKDLHGATLLASRIGQGFGLALMLIGFLSVLNGYLVSGLWWVLIGLFLRFAASASYRQLQLSESLDGMRVRTLMSDHPVAVPPDATLRELFDDYVYKYHHEMFPVVKDKDLVGCINANWVRSIDLHEWDRRTVADLSRDCGPENTIAADVEAGSALKQMMRTGNSQLIVVDRERLAGMLTLRDLVRYQQQREQL